MRLVFLGSGAFGLPTLQHLHREHEVRLVVSQPDRPAGRGGKLRATPIAEWAAAETELDIFKPDRINTDDARERVRAVEADAWVVIAYGQKLGQKLLADRFAVNLHASLLPRWRGAAPIHHAILAGDTETGNSVITLAEEMDAGAVLGQDRRPIAATQTTGELHDLLAAEGPSLVDDVLDRFLRSTLEYRTQDENLVTLAPKLSKAESTIDFSHSAESVRSRINGLSPWPGAEATLAGERVKLLRADRAPEARSAPPGTVLDADAGTVACGDGCVRLLEVQPGGKRPMDFAAFARGRSIESGARFLPTTGGRD